MALIRNDLFARLLIMAFLALAANSITALAQTTDDDTRGLKPREYAQKLQKKVTAKRPRSNQSQSNRPNRSKPVEVGDYAPVARDDNPVVEGVDVGVTFWQLREARKDDNPEAVEQTRIVKRKKGAAVESTAQMTPVRAQSETRFSDGDILRLTVEVPFESYIYLLNREQYADGTMSDPYLVFPARQDTGRSAKGVPGKLIYIPNETDYFEITRLSSEGPEKTAEVFTVLLSTEPLAELPPLADDEDYRRIDPRQLKEWESKWGGRVWKFEKIGGAGAAITSAEKKAGASGGALLSDSDPEPQTVYHVGRKPGEPLVFTIPVRIRK